MSIFQRRKLTKEEFSKYISSQCRDTCDDGPYIIGIPDSVDVQSNQKSMKIHIKFTGTDPQHSHMSVFVNGQCCGELCMSPDEADWFYLCVQAGAKALSPPGTVPIEFVGSGTHRPDEYLNPPPPCPDGC